MNTTVSTPSASREIALKVENLEVSYQVGQRRQIVIQDLTLEISHGEMTVIFGPSGCGKTSLLNTMGGMLTPSGGSVLWNGTDVTRMSERQKNAYRRDAVGFVFQQYNLIYDLTVEENIRVAAALAKDPRPVSEVLNLVGLSGREGSYPAQMSGGEQQRVCIARALVKRAGILLCDEPTGALDSKNAAQVLAILQDLTQNHGVSVVMITHNPLFAAIADHCITMRDGCIIEEYRQDSPLPVEQLALQG